jgi:uncharacterized membrane-anchored protein YhcB (DUF1043 family)
MFILVVMICGAVVGCFLAMRSTVRSMDQQLDTVSRELAAQREHVRETYRQALHNANFLAKNK